MLKHKSPKVIAVSLFGSSHSRTSVKKKIKILNSFSGSSSRKTVEDSTRKFRLQLQQRINLSDQQSLIPFNLTTEVISNRSTGTALNNARTSSSRCLKKKKKGNQIERPRRILVATRREIKHRLETPTLSPSLSSA